MSATIDATPTLSSAVVVPLAAADPDFAAPLIDPFLAFLARAAVLLILVEAGELSVDDALDRLMPAILQIADCRCYREIIERFDQAARDSDRRDDDDHGDAACYGRAAVSTVEVLEYELRTHGIDQLKRPRTQARLAELSADQIADLIAMLRRTQSAYPQISDRLIQLLQRVSK
jgi:hypothetical protein